ncbi:hypothetical protein CNR22_01885 [Sphingobacteriaceae bacterium]|nr:hypothetical protein CNR22_01885 [Sphingobacteriaceae bacterium]
MALLKIGRVHARFFPRQFKQLVILLFFTKVTFAQKINRFFYKDSTAFYLKYDTVYLNKIIPGEFNTAIHLALQYYPELYGAEIKFRIKKTISPLAARPTFWAIFRRPSKRKYLITISNSTLVKLTPILLKNLTFNSQVGVIGHELAHISFYQSKRGRYFMKLLLMHLSRRAIDTFECDTDKRCIDHGLGFQLLSWSKEVRVKLVLKQWGGSNSPEGKRERYMNPETISKYMSALPVYF